MTVAAVTCAVESRFPDLAIGRPTLATGLPAIKIYAQCHNGRSDQPTMPEEPDSVCFQSGTLTWSRCFTESDNDLDCLTCRDPRQNAATDHDDSCLGVPPVTLNGFAFAQPKLWKHGR